MRTADVAPRLRQHLVPVADRPEIKAFVPPPPPRAIDVLAIRADLLAAQEALEHARVAVDALPDPDLPMRVLEFREAVTSSQIEGTRTGVEELAEYEATGSSEGLPADVQITSNYLKALSAGLYDARHHGRAGLGLPTLQRVHEALMAGQDYPGVPGEIRQRQNWIGGFRIQDATLVTPPPDRVSGCLAELEDYLRDPGGPDARGEIPIVVRMAVAHAQFEAIHPFDDGNGRVGRILMPLMLAAEGWPPLYLSGFLLQHRRDYYDRLGGAVLRAQWQPWIGMVAEATVAAGREAMFTANRLIELQVRWKQLTATLRSDAAARRLPALLLRRPVVTVDLVARALGVSFQTANAALAMAVRQGIVEVLAKRGRARLFGSPTLLQILKRPSPG